MYTVASSFMFHSRSIRDDIRFARASRYILYSSSHRGGGLLFTPGSQLSRAYDMPDLSMPLTSIEEEPIGSDAEDYEDAGDGNGFEMDLHTALNQCTLAIQKFFNNDVEGAYRIMTPWMEQSLYHAHGAAIFEFIPAVLTLDREQTRKAQAALNHTISLYERTRKNTTIIQSIIKPNYESYTDLQAHAELIHAECQMLVACLAAFESEDLKGLLRVSFRIRSSFSSYKSCFKILQRKVFENMESRGHFESGVKLGLATFNVMIAMLPPKLITLLEFVGFSADKDKGLADLLRAVEQPGLRTVMSRLTLLAYHLVIGHYASLPPDFQIVDHILTTSLNDFPKSVWFLLFRGRYMLLRGKTCEAVDIYNDVANIHNIWPQIRHLAYWECMWANMAMLKWREAGHFAARLVDESVWSPTIYMYAQAVSIMESGSQATPAEINEAEALFACAPTHRQRIMGRSLPMEKFVIKRCERRASRGFLILPGVEMMCLWNMFPTLALDPEQTDKILKLIENTRKELTSAYQPFNTVRPDWCIYDTDDKALVHYLQGALYSAMGLPWLAIEQLREVLKLKDGIKENLYLVPYATVELAMCHYALNDPKLALSLLHEARKKYSGFILDSRLHFRIHAQLDRVRAAQIAEAKRIRDERKPVVRPNAGDTEEAVAQEPNTNDKAQENDMSVITTQPGTSQQTGISFS